MKKNLVSALAVVFIVALAIASGSSKSDKSEASPDQSIEGEAKVQSLWKYEQDEDKMEGTTIYMARLLSTNELNFKFPYKGGSKLSIDLRHKDAITDVFIRVTKGQIMPSFSGKETLKFKFDDEDTVKFTYSTSPSSSNNFVFMNDPKGVIKKLLTAKKIMIEVPIYNEGLQVFEFDAEGLAWDKL